MTLTDFLLARLTEDEAAAHEANSNWGKTEQSPVPDPAGSADDWYWSVNFSPPTVLADCKAKRGIVGLHADVRPDEGSPYWHGPHACLTCGPEDGTDDTWPCETLRLLALPYANHIDYQASWAPIPVPEAGIEPA